MVVNINNPPETENIIYLTAVNVSTLLLPVIVRPFTVWGWFLTVTPASSYIFLLIAFFNCPLKNKLIKSAVNRLQTFLLYYHSKITGWNESKICVPRKHFSPLRNITLDSASFPKNSNGKICMSTPTTPIKWGASSIKNDALFPRRKMTFKDNKYSPASYIENWTLGNSHGPCFYNFTYLVQISAKLWHGFLQHVNFILCPLWPVAEYIKCWLIIKHRKKVHCIVDP